MCDSVIEIAFCSAQYLPQDPCPGRCAPTQPMHNVHTAERTPCLPQRLILDVPVMTITPILSMKIYFIYYIFLGWGGPGHGELAKLTHQKALEKSLRIKDQSCLML